MTKNLLIVESPAKARTIEKYLGSDYRVLASYGHVRDLRPKEGAVEPDNDFAMHYELIGKNRKHVGEIIQAMKHADVLLLATDPDREGEAISWHVSEILRESDALDGKPVGRVVFHEITRRAIEEAVEHPRQLSMELVNAQQARRALDYLVGFNLSPLLWKKIRRGLSAGRVQSPALRMIVEREEEIERFKQREYWTIEADLLAHDTAFSARLVHHEGEKLTQFSVTTEAQAREAEQRIAVAARDGLRVVSVERKQRKRHPAAPFTTSTLQQEAARKIGFTASRTMRVAQQLYEGVEIEGGLVGLITYMRTDSVTLAREALGEIRDFVREQYGEACLPRQARAYRTKAKNAQEAHEAVRPTSVKRTPDSVRRYLNRDQHRLYELVWKRTVACQMQHATIETLAVELACPAATPDAATRSVFRATGSTVLDAGFMIVYQEDVDDPQAGKEPEENRRLPPLVEGDVAKLQKVRPEQHFTEPPPRYSEASLVKALEEYGIGRPSTYAAIISTLQQREYVVLDKRRFRPTDVGRIVNKFLTEHFSQYVDYEFTARLEDDLDAISRGEREWVPLMHAFWRPFKERVDEKTTSVSRREVTEVRELGAEPESGQRVSVRMGRYGPYVQLGTPEGNVKPRFASLRPGQEMGTIGLDEALALFELPRDLGKTAAGEPLAANIGRFGPYLRYGDKFVSLGKDDDPYTVTLERALELVAEKIKADASREIQVFEDAGIRVLRGRYGPYITNGTKNARVPKGREPETVTLEEARELLEKAPAPRRRRGARSS